MNKENLLKMADYIETIPQESFDMNDYRSGQRKTPECRINDRIKSAKKWLKELN